MKGQRLFMREAAESDRAGITTLMEGAAPPFADAEWVVAKLVGDLVAAAAFVRAGGTAELTALTVREDLRGKGVGRLILAEVEQRLASAGHIRLVIRKGLLPEPFFERAGYDFRDGSFVKELENQDPA